MPHKNDPRDDALNLVRYIGAQLGYAPEAPIELIKRGFDAVLASSRAGDAILDAVRKCGHIKAREALLREVIDAGMTRPATCGECRFRTGQQGQCEALNGARVHAGAPPFICPIPAASKSTASSSSTF